MIDVYKRQYKSILTSKNLDLISGWEHLRPDRNAGSNLVVNSEVANEGSLH